MIEIPLQNGMTALIDDADKTRVDAIGYRWRAVEKGGMWYAVGLRTPMHRWILGLEGRGHTRVKVDHWNKNTLDNRRENLRVATHMQSCWNRRSTGGASRFKGVSIRRDPRMNHILWRARITAAGKLHILGHFRNEEDAARAYDAAALALHGEFAQINFPTNGKPSAALVSV